MSDLSSLWPLYNIKITSGDVELRFPSDEDLLAVVKLVKGGIHEPNYMPFNSPWSLAKEEDLGPNTLKHFWGHRVSWTPTEWFLNLVVCYQGTVVGCQDINAKNFGVLKTVSTGSWLGKNYQGQGIGTLMRQAVLCFAFEGLGANYAISGAFLDNASSLKVSQKLGYELNGVDIFLRQGKASKMQRLMLDRKTWESSSRPSVDIFGLEDTLPWFGV